MLIEWTQLFEQIQNNQNYGPGAVKLAAELAAAKLDGGNPAARDAWLAIVDLPAAKRRKQVLKALQLSGLPPTVSEADWRKLLYQAPFHIPSSPTDDLLHEAMEIAATRINDIEWPPVKNQGDDLIPYRQAADINVGDHWCMAFVVWCINQAARSLELANPLKATGKCLTQWEHAQKVAAQANSPLEIITAEQARAGQKVNKGAIFIHQYGGGHGHTGFVAEINSNGDMVTIEGNSNPFGVTGLGLGVFKCEHRKLGDKALEGFIQMRPRSAA
jgi:CHAP domain